MFLVPLTWHFTLKVSQNILEAMWYNFWHFGPDLLDNKYQKIDYRKTLHDLFKNSPSINVAS